MAFLPSPLLFYGCSFLLLIFIFLLHSPQAYGGLEEGQLVASLRSLLPDTVCSWRKAQNSSAALKVVHREGPCSPLDPHQRPSHVQILNQDQDRVDSLQRRASAAAGGGPVSAQGPLQASVPARRGASLGTLNYVVTLGFGTPKKDLTVVFDTGSDLSWIQCEPCILCYPQQEPLFDPSESSTYRDLSCSSAECTGTSSHNCSAEMSCRYEVRYGDRSETDGYLSRDTLTLTPSDALPGFLFGCGDRNTGLFGRTAGMLGLGRGKESLPSQLLAASYRHGRDVVFSYCLPSTPSATGYLSIGGAAPRNVRYTPMMSAPGLPSFYFLELVAVAVGGWRLAVPRWVFRISHAMIDSGTVITRLPPAAYAALRSAFRWKMAKYAPAPALSILDTCYNFTGHQTVAVPEVAMEFAGGVSMQMDFTGILYVASVSQACLAFAGNIEPWQLTIIGNVQQKRLNVVYDVGKRRVGFGAGGCE